MPKFTKNENVNVDVNVDTEIDVNIHELQYWSKK